MQTLLNVEGATHSGETVTISASVNTDAFSESGADLAALRVWIGTDQVVTSDYIVVKASTDKITPIIVDTTATTVGGEGVPFYTRTKGFGTDGESVTETSAFIHEFVKTEDYSEPELDDETETDKNGLVSAQFPYDDTLDLTTLVGLYSDEVLAYVADLDITGISYEFSIPADYTLADGVNQQLYIEFADDDCTKVKAAQGTLSVDKFPVVRCDAYIDGKLVASTYILLQITGQELEEQWFPITGYDVPTITDGTPDKTVNDYLHANVNYRALEDGVSGNNYNYTFVADISGEEFLEDIKTLGFESADEFFTYYNENYFAMLVPYDGDDDAVTHDPTKIATEWDGMRKWKFSGDAPNGGMYPGKGKLGYYYSSDWGFGKGADISATGDSLAFRLAFSDHIFTQHTYTDVTCSVCGGHGAEYLVRLTFESLNTSITPEFNLFAFVHIYDDCGSQTLNPAYLISDPTAYGLDEGAEAVIVKGNVGESGTWELTSNVTEHFLGGDVFSTSTPDDYGKYPNNVKDVEFEWSEPYYYNGEDDTEGYWVSPDYGTGISSGSSSYLVGMAAEMDEAYKTYGLDCNEVLTNGEYCPYSYWVVFVNPFQLSDETGAVTIPDGLGAVTVNLGTGLTVTDTSGNVILYYDADAEAWTLTSTATDGYYLGEDSYTIAYEFDEEDEGYQELVAELGDDYLTIDTETGDITWENGGTALMKSYTFSVKATVTFEGICVIECTITVTLSPAN